MHYKLQQWRHQHGGPGGRALPFSWDPAAASVLKHSAFLRFMHKMHEILLKIYIKFDEMLQRSELPRRHTTT